MEKRRDFHLGKVIHDIPNLLIGTGREKDLPPATATGSRSRAIPAEHTDADTERKWGGERRGAGRRKREAREQEEHICMGWKEDRAVRRREEVRVRKTREKRVAAGGSAEFLAGREAKIWEWSAREARGRGGRRPAPASFR